MAGKKILPELVRRQRAFEMTERHFAGRPWEPGKVDCARMAGFHLKRFGWRLPRVAHYSTIEQGTARLLALGVATLPELLDRIGLQRIAPAAARLGDIVSIPSGDDAGQIGALGLAIGNGSYKVFHPDHEGLVSFRTQLVLAAWSVTP